MAEHEEALLAAGYIKTKPSSYSGRRGWRGGRGVITRIPSGNSCYQRGGGNRGNIQNARKNVNPTGPDGRLLTCKSCGSFRHLVANCPDSWGNLAKVNITENENEKKHVVLSLAMLRQRSCVWGLTQETVQYYTAPAVVPMWGNLDKELYGSLRRNRQVKN